MVYGIVGLLILVLDVVVLLKVWGGNGSAGYKLVWTLIILLLPLIGLLLYALLGQRKVALNLG